MADRVRPRLAWAASLAAVVTVVLTTAACSVSVPLPAFVDRVPTGSVGQPVALWSSLDTEDLRRANAAMAVALDPQGNGEMVTWDNPKSGHKGSFAAAAAPYPAQDLICRSFKAQLVLHTRSEQRIDGAACRGRDGEWALAKVAHQK